MKWLRAPFLTFLTLAILAVVVGNFINTGATSDSAEYLQAARNWVEQGVLNSSADLTDVEGFSKRPPAYPALLIAVSAWNYTWLWRMVQLVLLVAGMLLVHRAMEKTPGFSSDRFWWWACLTPVLFIYPGLVMAETLLLFEFAGLFYLLMLYFRDPKFGLALAAAGVVALMILTKPMAIALVALLPIALLWKRQNARIAFAGLVPLMVVALWMLRNQQHTGVAEISSISTINFVYYNTYHLVRETEGDSAAAIYIEEVEQIRESGRPYGVIRAQLRETALNRMLEHKWFYLSQHVKGMAKMLLDPGRFDWTTYLGRGYEHGLLNEYESSGVVSRLWQEGTAVFILLIVFFLVNGAKLFFAARTAWMRIRLPAVWLCVVLVVYALAVTGSIGASRFLMPVQPFLIALAAVHIPIPRRGNGPAAD